MTKKKLTDHQKKLRLYAREWARSALFTSYPDTAYALAHKAASTAFKAHPELREVVR